MPQLFLNEVSCTTAYGTDRVNRAMTEMVRAVVAVAAQDRPGTVLVTSEPINGLQLADGHPIGKWYGVPQNRDYWLRLRQMQNKWPTSTVIPEGTDISGMEYRHDGVAVHGLGLADELDGIGVSLPLEPRWDAAWLRLRREELVEDTGTDQGGDGFHEETTDVDVRHASRREHVDVHLPWIRDSAAAERRAGLRAIRTGPELWARRDALFPHLRFLPRVEADLLDLREVWVWPVCKRLAELDGAVHGWDAQAEPEGPLWGSKVTREHQHRRELCWFEDLDGGRQLFDTHARFTPDAGRLHFRWVAETRFVHVAYIGLKLGL